MLDIARIRADFPILSTQARGKPLVYLDNAATTQVPEPVLQAICGHYRTRNANVHRGTHYLAHLSTDALEQARRTVAAFVGSSSENCIVFTRGATDSLNMVAAGLAPRIGAGERVVTTILEHHSNFVPWQQVCKARGAELAVAGIDEQGELDLDELSALLAGAPARRGFSGSGKPGAVRVVAITGCSNVLGCTTPVRRIAEMAHAAGALVVLDAAQLMRHDIVDLQNLHCDFLAFSGHKMLAGTGIGVLAGTPEAMEFLHPRDFGGEMVDQVRIEDTTWEALPLRLEAGTPNYVGAVALAAACDYLRGLGRAEVALREDELIAHAQKRLTRIEGLRILGNPRKRSGALSFCIEGVHPLDLCTMVDLSGVALRSGHNCALPLLSSLGLTSVARMSPAFYNTFDEVDYAAEQIEKAAALLRSRARSDR